MKSLTLLFWGLFLIGCAEGNCRQVAAADAKAKGLPANAEIVTTIPPGPQDHVKVFKYDGSLQCGMGKAISPEEMKSQLKDIKVFSVSNKADGLMHMQACGTGTGKANVYEIDRHQLADAIKLGFKAWLWE